MNDVKIKRLQVISDALKVDTVDSKQFVAVIEQLMKYVQNGQKLTADALTKMKEITDKIDSSFKALKSDIDAETRKTIKDELAQIKSILVSYKPVKGDPGKDYILTEADKQEIAQSIRVPIIEKNISVAEPAEAIRNKLETLTGDGRLDISAIRGVEELKKSIQHIHGTVGGGVTPGGAQVLTKKRIVKRSVTITSSATPTINTDTTDYFEITAQAADITSFTTNLKGTPYKGDTLWIAITGTGARAITWGASFEASTVSLPTTTVSTNRLDVGFVWNSATSKWRCVAQS